MFEVVFLKFWPLGAWIRKFWPQIRNLRWTWLPEPDSQIWNRKSRSKNCPIYCLIDFSKIAGFPLVFVGYRRSLKVFIGFPSVLAGSPSRQLIEILGKPIRVPKNTYDRAKQKLVRSLKGLFRSAIVPVHIPSICARSSERNEHP